MAIDKIDFPTSGTPSLPTDYTLQNENIERAVRGSEYISLTNWDTGSSAPAVIVGSVVESNGVLYDVITGNESISTTGASSGIVYLKFDDTGGSEEFVWDSTAPTWSATLNGWYIGSDKCTGHRCRWDGATSFTDKCRLTRFGADDAPAPAGYSIADTGVATQLTIPSGTLNTVRFYLPAGYIQFGAILNSGAGNLILECTNDRNPGSQLVNALVITAGASSNEYTGAGIISNGNNYAFRVSATAGADKTIDYMIFR